MATTEADLIALMNEGLTEATKALVKRAKSGEITAAEISQLRSLFKDAGGALQTSQGQPTTAGDSVLEGMGDLGDAELNALMN